MRKGQHSCLWDQFFLLILREYGDFVYYKDVVVKKISFLLSISQKKMISQRAVIENL